MKTVAIAKIEIDPKGWLRVYPDSEQYDFIYRAAADVHWEKEGGFLHSREPEKWTYPDYFTHIVQVVSSEYGDTLKTNQKTEWIRVPDSIRAEIQK